MSQVVIGDADYDATREIVHCVSLNENTMPVSQRSKICHWSLFAL